MKAVLTTTSNSPSQHKRPKAIDRLDSVLLGTIVAKIKGWAKPLPFIRHAAQDCKFTDPTGTKPGPGEQVNYPGPEIPATAREGLSRAAETLEKYPAVTKAPAEYAGYLYND